MPQIISYKFCTLPIIAEMVMPMQAFWWMSETFISKIGKLFRAIAFFFEFLMGVPTKNSEGSHFMLVFMNTLYHHLIQFIK